MSLSSDAIYYMIVFLAGTCIGSFLNVCIYRIPAGKSIVYPPSACMKCGHKLSWWENIPLFSYIFLRAKCRKCSASISIQYPLVEFLTGLLALLLFHKFGPTPQLFVYALFTAALIVITFIDLELQVIPDVISLPGIVFGLVASFFLPGISFIDSAAGVLLGGGILIAVAWGYYLITKREGMGGGDVKLLAMIGAFLGWKCLPVVVFLSAAAGSVTGLLIMAVNRGNRHTAIPYGPFLAAGAVAYIFFGEGLIRLYLNALTN